MGHSNVKMSGRRPSKGGRGMDSEAGGKLRGNDLWKPSEENVFSREWGGIDQIAK